MKALSADRRIVLDGGLATELEAQGRNIDTNLWSAELLQSNPSAIVDAHLAYLDAGAEIIISASYQASRLSFESSGVSASEADELILKSVKLAREAAQRFVGAHPKTVNPLIVAASVGPYGAALHDGSEYTGIYEAGEDVLREFHEARLRLLDQSGADVLACETVPNRTEAGVLHDLLLDVRLPAWVSFCCRDERCISDGTALQELAKNFRDHPRVMSLGINCTAPHLISSLIGEIRMAAPNKAIVVYPNSGETYEVSDNSWHGTATQTEWAAAAANWWAMGASIVGGCCRVGPEQIRSMAGAR